MSRTNTISLAVTVVLAIGYFARQRVPVPDAAPFNLGTLGLFPAFGAFLFVEVLSCFLPPLSTFRQQGVSGRRKLNIAGILLALVIAALQGWAGAQGLLSDPEVRIGLLDDDMYLQTAHTKFVIRVVLYLLGGAVLATVLAHGITRFGLTNGFPLLMLGGGLCEQVADARPRKAGTDRLLNSPFRRYRKALWP
jgi:preprotein translocase subunit SecY